MRNRRFFIDNLTSDNPSFGEELYSRSFLVDIIDLITASIIKDMKINGNYMQRLSFLIAFVKMTGSRPMAPVLNTGPLEGI